MYPNIHERMIQDSAINILKCSFHELRGNSLMLIKQKAPEIARPL